MAWLSLQAQVLAGAGATRYYRLFGETKAQAANDGPVESITA